MTKPSRGPAPVVTEDSDGFWDRAAAGRLRGQRCRRAGGCTIRPRPCAPPVATRLEHSATGAGGGRVYSYAILHHPQHPAFDYPHRGVLVELDEGVRLLSNLVGVEPAAVDNDMMVEVCFVDYDGTAVPVFRPRRTAVSASTAAAIVGIGQTEFSKAAGRSETQLAAEASRPRSPTPG